MDIVGVISEPYVMESPELNTDELDTDSGSLMVDAPSTDNTDPRSARPVTETVLVSIEPAALIGPSITKSPDTDTALLKTQEPPTDKSEPSMVGAVTESIELEMTPVRTSAEVTMVADS